MRVAIVTPWFGRELKGGAEQQAWQIASRLAVRGHTVEVVTTCCRSHQEDWATNHLPHGYVVEPEGFAIRRFPVNDRDRAEFDRVCGHLLRLEVGNLKPGVSPVSAEDSRIFARELIKSQQLLNFLSAQQHTFDAFILLPYLYGPVLDAVQILGDRAHLQPCLHDEAYAYLPEVAEAFYHAGSLLFNSEGELELAAKLYGPAILTKSVVAGEGVETVGSPPGVSRNGSPNENKERYLLYLGRKDPGKNVDLLVRAFQRFRAVRPNSNLRLLLAGYGSINLNGQNMIVDLGLVSESEKEKLLCDCVALAQPSQNESFSRVMMEAWIHRRPVAVHARCLATATAVRHAEGGWLADDDDDWARLLVEIDRLSSAELDQLGENGRRYASSMADWEKVMERYEAALFTPPSGPSKLQIAQEDNAAAINQFLPNLEYGDAISNHAIWIRDQLRKWGFRSEIYVRHIDFRVAGECHAFTPEALHASDAAIYHHSIGTEITPHMLEFHGPKCLIYHNITPAEFFQFHWPEFATILAQGREDLPRLAEQFPHSCGDSAYNVLELADAGFPQPGVLPLAITPVKWAAPPDPQLMGMLQDGRTNLLFVGRFAPNKKQDDLIAAFSHYLALDPAARLILVGKPEESDPYVAHVRDIVCALGLEESVVFTGSITDVQLAAYYRTAHLFWSMSEHEGFCVPIVEAMWFDVPVLAFKSSAVPETLGNAALLFTTKEDLAAVAALARLIVEDANLRGRIIRRQRDRRLSFLPGKIEPLLAKIAEQLVGAYSK